MDNFTVLGLIILGGIVAWFILRGILCIVEQVKKEIEEGWL